MATDWNKLLRHIVRTLVTPNAGTEAQLDATAVQDVDSELEAIREEQSEDANRLSAAFARGMELAMRTEGPLMLDDTSPEHGDVISALARYLVATDLADSQSAQLANGSYMYTFEVKWPRLRDVARAADVELERDE